MGKKYDKADNLQQLPSGSWRFEKMINGQRIRITFPGKPTQAEIQLAIAERLQVNPEDIAYYKQTFKVLAESYIKSKRQVLSVATIREYERLLNNVIPADLLKTPLSKISQVQVQSVVNDYASNHKPKSTANYSSFICSVLRMYGKNYRITLPLKTDSDVYIPTNEDVKSILDAVRDTRFEIPFMLAVYGLRRSEILAVTADDIEIIDDTVAVVHVTKGLVEDSKHVWVTKSPKTRQSKRDVNISVDLAQKIINQGFAYQGNAGYINDRLHEIQDKLGIQRFSLHKLRHFFATWLSENGINEADILSLGGWSTPNIMKSVYRHSRLKDDETARQTIINNLTNDIS